MPVIVPSMSTITIYTDYKSPYAFLANDRIHALADATGVTIDWRPYVLNVPLYLGSATVDTHGTMLEANRNPHQWRRIRYMFMDCRRQARKQGLVLRATQKIWDSAPAAAGMLFAQQAGRAAFRHNQCDIPGDIDLPAQTREHVGPPLCQIDDTGRQATRMQQQAQHIDRRTKQHRFRTRDQMRHGSVRRQHRPMPVHSKRGIGVERRQYDLHIVVNRAHRRFAEQPFMEDGGEASHLQ